MEYKRAAKLTRAAMIAAVYFSLTAALAPISFGFLQLRLAECLCILPIFFPEAIFGLTVGCFLSNILFSTPLDALFGTTATLLASLFTIIIAKKIKNCHVVFVLNGLFAAFFNAFLVPLGFMLFTFTWSAYFISAAEIALSEALSVFAVGSVLYRFLYSMKKRADE